MVVVAPANPQTFVQKTLESPQAGRRQRAPGMPRRRRRARHGDDDADDMTMTVLLPGSAGLLTQIPGTVASHERGKQVFCKICGWAMRSWMCIQMEVELETFIQLEAQLGMFIQLEVELLLCCLDLLWE